MPTPTTNLVLARERTPPMFRPGNQARLEPAQPTNFAPSQDMLPGMGEARSGNAKTGNGLSPHEDRVVAVQAAKQHVQRQAKNLDRVIAQLQQRLAELTAEGDQARVRGDGAERAVGRTRRQQAQMLKAKIAELKRAQDVVLGKARPMYGQAGHKMLAPWEMRPVFKDQNNWLTRVGHHFLKAQPIRRVYAPATPDPLDFEPEGISHQTDRRKVEAMQANVEPVVKGPRAGNGMSGPGSGMWAGGMGSVDGIVDQAQAWFKGETFGIPNWALAGGGGLFAVLLLLRPKRRVVFAR